jgi:hypothetical protein
MEDFVRLFGGLLAFVYHCFDRIVILGYLPLLTRPENIVHFFRDMHGVGAITKEVLRQRTTEYKSMGGSLRQESRDPYGVGGEGRTQGRLLPFAYGRRGSRRRARTGWDQPANVDGWPPRATADSHRLVVVSHHGAELLGGDVLGPDPRSFWDFR